MLHHRSYPSSPDHPWIVVLHGAGGSSSIWHHQIRAFKSKFNVLTMDLRGHGQTGVLADVPLDAAYGFGLIVDDVVKVLDHLKIRHAHFAGVSLGSILLRELQHRFPDRVLSMVHSGAIVRLDATSRLLIRFGHAAKSWIPFIWLYTLFAWIIMPGAPHRRTREMFVSEAKRIPQDEFIRWFKLTLSVQDVLDRFLTVRMEIPNLFVMGDRDRMFLPAVRDLVKRHPGYGLHVVRNCGHVCNVEAPDVFNSAAFSFYAASFGI